MLVSTQICQHRPIALNGVQCGIFQFSAVLIEEGFRLLNAIGAKALMHDKGAGGSRIAQELRGTLVRSDHALLDQVLRGQLLVAIDLRNLLVIPEHPPVFAALLHDQFVLFPVFSQSSVYLHQRFEWVCVRDQVVAVAGDVTINRGIGELRARSNNGAVELKALDLACFGNLHLADQGRSGYLQPVHRVPG